MAHQRTYSQDLFRTLGTEFDRFFGDFPFVSEGKPAARASFPPLNAWEDEENYRVELEVPGVSLADLDLEVREDSLTIRGERRVESAPEGASHRNERSAGAFEREVRLPAAVDAAKVRAELQDGVLTVTLPKPEAVKARKIEIRSKG
jgi:HSP20 family protein